MLQYKWYDSFTCERILAECLSVPLVRHPACRRLVDNDKHDDTPQRHVLKVRDGQKADVNNNFKEVMRTRDEREPTPPRYLMVIAVH